MSRDQGLTIDLFSVGHGAALGVVTATGSHGGAAAFNADESGEDIYDMAGGAVVSIGNQEDIYDMAGGGVATGGFDTYDMAN